MVRYLFLDLYGVLALDGWGANDPYGNVFDAMAVDNLQRIIDDVHPKIVITSTWRTQGMEWLKAMWHYRQLPGEIYSATPILERTQYEVVDPNHIGSVYRIPERYAKGLEVERWLQTNADGPYKYAIIDDEPYFLMGQSSHFVQADPLMGLTDSVATRTVQLLQ